MPERWSWRRAIGLALLIGLAYALGSEIAAAWFEADGTNASFFPAAGVTMAAVIALEVRWWPSVMVGAGVAEVLVDLAHDLPFDVSLAYAGANLGQALVGCRRVARRAGHVGFAAPGQRLTRVERHERLGKLPGPDHVALVHVVVHRRLSRHFRSWRPERSGRDAGHRHPRPVRRSGRTGARTPPRRPGP